MTSPWPFEPWTTERRLEAHRFGPEFPAPPCGVIWVPSGDAPGDVSALLVAHRANRAGRQPHFVWSPEDGVIQMTPLTHTSRLFRSGSPAEGLVAVLVVTEADLALKPGESPAETPLGPLLADLGIPLEWPAGPPRIDGPRVLPTKPGHYASAQVIGA